MLILPNRLSTPTDYRMIHMRICEMNSEGKTFVRRFRVGASHEIMLSACARPANQIRSRIRSRPYPEALRCYTRRQVRLPRRETEGAIRDGRRIEAAVRPRSGETKTKTPPHWSAEAAEHLLPAQLHSGPRLAGPSARQPAASPERLKFEQSR